MQDPLIHRALIVAINYLKEEGIAKYLLRRPAPRGGLFNINVIYRPKSIAPCEGDEVSWNSELETTLFARTPWRVWDAVLTDGGFVIVEPNVKTSHALGQQTVSETLDDAERLLEEFDNANALWLSARDTRSEALFALWMFSTTPEKREKALSRLKYETRGEMLGPSKERKADVIQGLLMQHDVDIEYLVDWTKTYIETARPMKTLLLEEVERWA